MKKKLTTIGLLICFLTINAQQKSSYQDTRDGKNYKTVIIGKQTWFAENIAYLPSSGNYWAFNNKSENIIKYGYLYDWKTAKKVCPNDWHLPSIDEWNILFNELGGKEVAGPKMITTSDWII